MPDCKIGEKAITIAPYYWELLSVTQQKNNEIAELKVQVGDFWEFLIEQDLLEEFRDWLETH